MPLLRKLILLCQCLLLFPDIKAQSYSYINYDVKEGLAGSMTYCSIQDKDGFIWIGTETGLSRFDGQRFKNYTVQDGLPDNEIIRLFVDSQNRVWCIPFKNTIAYYYAGAFYTPKNDSILKKLNIGSEVIAVQENKRGDILILENFKLNIIKPDGRVVSVNKVDNKSFLSIGVRKNGQNGFTIATLTNGPGVDVYSIEDAQSTFLEKVNYIGPVSSQTISISPNWEMIKKGDSLLFSQSPEHRQFSVLAPRNLVSTTDLSESAVAINTATGTTIYELAGGALTQERLLTSSIVTSVMKDREQHIWFTTAGKGIYKLPSKAFRTFTFSFNNEASLPVFSIQKKEDHLYAGTQLHTLYELNISNASLIPQQFNNFGIGTINTLHFLRNQDLLIGTSTGLYVKDKTGFKPFALPAKSIKAVQPLDGRILVSTNDQVLLFDLLTKDTTVIWSGRATSACYDPFSHCFFIGTLNGLYQLKGSDRKYLGDRHDFFKSRISAIGLLPDNSICVATYGSGIAQIRNDSILRQITLANGLSSNNCRSLFIKNQEVFAGTDAGLNKITFHQDTFTIIKYRTSDGLPSDIINAIFVENDTVYTGTPAGLTFFDERNISNNSFPDIKILDVFSAGNKLDHTSGKIALPYNQNNIRFDFTAITFKSPTDLLYEYRMLGLDTGWRATTQPFLEYPQLQSGDYVFQVRVINKWRIKSAIQQIAFSIATPFWEMTIFKIVILLLVIAISWALINYRVKKIRSKEQEKTATNKKILELEQMALKAQMNPHFIFNSLNSIQQYVIRKDIQGANRFISNFSKLIRQTFENSARPKITLGEELNYLSTYLELEKERSSHKFDYTTSIDKGILTDELFLTPLIIQPYLENCVRHGIGPLQDRKGLIEMEVKLHAGCLLFVVQDNGVGRVTAGKYKMQNIQDHLSRGTTITAERIALLNQHLMQKISIRTEDLYDNEGLPFGTKVIIHFPLTYAQVR